MFPVETFHHVGLVEVERQVQRKIHLVAPFRGRMVVAVTDLNAERKKHVKQQALHSRLQRDLADVQSQLQGAFLHNARTG